MKVLFDSSVLVAAMWESHPAHTHALLWLTRAKEGAFEFYIAGHGLLETYSVLTRLPIRPKPSPALVLHFIDENVLSVAEVIAPSRSDYRSLLEEMVRLDLVGGVAYDALIAFTATLAGADHLLTLNERDFNRVWPGAANRVLSPLTSSPPAADAD